MIPPIKFGSHWKAIVANDDDWADECKSSETAFATTERAGPLDTISGTIDNS